MSNNPSHIIEIRKALEEAVQRLNDYEDLVENIKRGEAPADADPTTSLAAIHTLAVTKIAMGAAHQMMDHTMQARQKRMGRLRAEWIAENCQFRPKTDMEKDLWEAFHKFKDEGYSVLVFYSDSHNRTHPIIPIGKGMDTDEAIESIKQMGMTSLMVVLDLHKTFQEQWPYMSGAIDTPLQLTENPIIRIPQLQNAKQHPRAPHLRAVVNE